MIGLLIRKQGRRILFIVSVHNALKHEGLMNDISIHQLNAVLRLANDERSFELPLSLSKKIWKPSDIESNVHITPLSKNSIIAKQFVDYCPPWLDYGKLNMLTDMSTMLDLRR